MEKKEMSIRFHSPCIFCLFIFSHIHAQQKSSTIPVYKDSTKPVEQRVNDLLKQMTADEKAQQLQSQLLFLPNYSKRNFAVGNFRAIAHFLHVETPATPAACAEAINEDTRKSIAASRLGIPVLQHDEALHGAQWGMATVFPQCIAFAATFDDSLVYRIGLAVGSEVRAVGVRQILAPMVNISRDPRWGRVQETYGEDVYLCSRMGVAYTKALERSGIIATPKALVDNYGAAGHDSYASENSWRVLREIYLEPFRACIEEGGAGSVMAAYNSLDGVPCSNNSHLLKNILRKEWRFKGFVVSDYGGVVGVWRAHDVTPNYATAQAESFRSGMDVELANGYRDLPELVKSGRISEKQLDSSVKRLLAAKFQLGLFEHPYVDAEAADKIVRSAEHKNLSLETARKSIVLLKNEKQILPLSKNKIKRLAVFGPAAFVLTLGDYTGPVGGWKGDGAVTPLEGLVETCQGKIEIISWKRGMHVDSLARTCDAAIFFAAIHEGEAMDRSKLELPAVAQQNKNAGKSSDNAVIVEDNNAYEILVDQEKMIMDISSTGTPTIVVLETGAPVDMRKWESKVDGIIEAWYPGEQGGTAIADVLFGDSNPSGRLPITWPKHVGQVPTYYAVKPSGRSNNYIDDDGKPMYPFGYGLSYTTFAYSDLTLPASAKHADSVRIYVTVKNTGSVAGDEIVQLYLHHEGIEVVQSIRELKAFKRVSLEPGESKEVELVLAPRAFGYWNKDLHFTMEPGRYTVYISKDADHDILSTTFELR